MFRRPLKARPVLFVDDSAVARATAKRRLGEHGLAVTVLGSSAEAAGVDGATFAAALLDIELGDGLGTEIATHLRERAPGLPIAFLTAGAPASALDVAQRLGPVFSKSTQVDDAMRWIAEAAALGRG